MTKTLPTKDIANELSGSSVFFQQPVQAKATPSTPELDSPKREPTTQTVNAIQSSVAQEAPAPLATPRSASINDRTNDQTNQRTNERSMERRRIRHTFDVFQDQLSSLRKIQIQREETFGKRYLLGELAQEALDLFITKERNNE